MGLKKAIRETNRHARISGRRIRDIGMIEIGVCKDKVLMKRNKFEQLSSKVLAILVVDLRNEQHDKG